MEEMNVNVEYDKSVYSNPSTNQTGPGSSDRRLYKAVVLCLGLMNVFLLAGLIVRGVHYYNSPQRAAAELSTIKDQLTELLQDIKNKVSSLTEERDQLNPGLNETAEELNKCQNKTCPAGWKKFSYSFYFFSTEFGSWTKGRDDCRKRGADLVVITSAEEQKFLSEFTRMATWIGLSDREREGTWRWIDGTTQTFENWDVGEPSDNKWHSLNGEDCAEINVQKGYRWNDAFCEVPQRWICEKNV
ncbi:CD209 antigen-like protein C [Channa argus]|uniref:CD209 antigen-like protein C n=1 Tax=Channa argus TaxID=215402 RepID=UPI00352009E7